MKTKFTILILSVIFMSSCDLFQTKGTLQLIINNPYATNNSAGIKQKIIASNPSLTSDTTTTSITSLKVCIGDIWISQDEIVAGEVDNLDWVRIGTQTNYTTKLFEDYTFSPVELNVGTYKSIKVTFKNVFYRHCVLNSNPSVSYDIFESSDESNNCNENDSTWATTNYIGTNGHYIQFQNQFLLISAKEKIDAFTIDSEKITGLQWTFGDENISPCTCLLFDINKNRTWDCGVDTKKITCQTGYEELFNFQVLSE